MKSIIGVLALQGAFKEHIDAFERLKKTGSASGDFECMLIKNVSDLDAVDALVIPGGESTSMATLAGPDLLTDIRMRNQAGTLPIWGTCAGLILLADKVFDDANSNDERQVIGGLPITVARNWYGSQVDSFIGNLRINQASFNPEHLPPSMGIFIRAPRINQIDDKVQVHASLVNQQQEEYPVAISNGYSILATTFHPELDPNNLGWHRFFLERFVFQKK